MTVRFAATMLIAIVLMGASAGRGAAANQANTQWSGVYSEAQAKRGAATYMQNCRNCHGSTLLGAEGGPSLTGADFDGNWNGRTLGDLFDKIRTTMPQSAPGSLSERESTDVLAFMLSVGTFPAGTSDLPGQAGPLSAIRYQARKP